jgi:hypothetical protein
MTISKTYLGDSVYASFDYIKLTCENGQDQDAATETIYLEEEVFSALLKFSRQWRPQETAS